MSNWRNGSLARMHILCQVYFLIFRWEMAEIRRVYALFSPVLQNGSFSFLPPVVLQRMYHNYILCFRCFAN
jgi:hypothetical protein